LAFAQSPAIGAAMGMGIMQPGSWLKAAMLLVALCALSARIMIPAGFMPGTGERIMLTICSGVDTHAAVEIDLGQPSKQKETMGEHLPCAFSSAAMPMLSGAPPVLLADAIAFVIERGIESIDSPALNEGLRLRPPLRGPPAV
jgi:hypothetical protein